MKTLKLIFIMSIMVKCQAQNPIFGLNESRLDQPNGYYLKDIITN